jgi:hydroxyacylglutathione hydrolase
LGFFMKLYTVKSEGLAHNSYLLADEGEAVVIDPRRDCQIYMHLAKKQCSKIRYILETHRHEDFVAGSLELQAVSRAEIGHSKQLSFAYGDHSLENNDSLIVGNLKIQVLSTPGHTNESLCYVVSDLQNSAEPTMVFTGDTLFVGSVGRTDLLGEEAHVSQAAKLYESLQEQVLKLNDGVLIYPAHGAGSVCGSEISDQPFSTVGYEKKTNLYLQLTKEEFVQRVLVTDLLVPPYFAKMEQYNLKGAPKLRGLPLPKALNAEQFADGMVETDSIVVDTRLPNAFAGSHVEGAFSIPLSATAVYPGWILDYEKRILLVAERKDDLRQAIRNFWRLGFDNVYGYLCTGMSGWQEEGRPIGHFGTLSVAELNSSLHRYAVLDVREPSEWQEGIIENAETIYFGELPKKAQELQRNKRFAVICSTGKRSSVAASILKRKGFEVHNVLGGMKAWNELGYPTTKPHENMQPQ